MHVNLYAFVSPWFQVYLAFARFCGPSCVGPRGQARGSQSARVCVEGPWVCVLVAFVCVWGGVVSQDNQCVRVSPCVLTGAQHLPLCACMCV